MPTMIMEPHLRSMREKNFEDLVWRKFPNYVVFSEPKFSLPSLPTNYILKIASFRLQGTNPDDPIVTIIEVLPLPPSRTSGNIGVSTGARQPSLAKILSQTDAYLWLYNDVCGRQPSYIKYKRRWYVYFDSIATVYQLKVAHRRLPPPCRCYAGCFRNNKQPLADVTVPEVSCVSGNEAIRYAGFITFT